MKACFHLGYEKAKQDAKHRVCFLFAALEQRDGERSEHPRQFFTIIINEIVFMETLCLG